MTTTFEDAKVGDRVYSPTYGWGEIEHVDIQSRLIYVRFSHSKAYDDYTVEGYLFDDLPIQSLFWDEVSIVAPTKPAQSTE